MAGQRRFNFLRSSVISTRTADAALLESLCRGCWVDRIAVLQCLRDGIAISPWPGPQARQLSSARPRWLGTELHTRYIHTRTHSPSTPSLCEHSTRSHSLCARSRLQLSHPRPRLALFSGPPLGSNRTNLSGGHMQELGSSRRSDMFPTASQSRWPGCVPARGGHG